jgi:hypothetical protein
MMYGFCLCDPRTRGLGGTRATYSACFGSLEDTEICDTVCLIMINGYEPRAAWEIRTHGGDCISGCKGHFLRVVSRGLCELHTICS